jgi:hypothetical protein
MTNCLSSSTPMLANLPSLLAAPLPPLLPRLLPLALALALATATALSLAPLPATLAPCRLLPPSCSVPPVLPLLLSFRVATIGRYLVAMTICRQVTSLTNDPVPKCSGQDCGYAILDNFLYLIYIVKRRFLR